MKKLFLLSAFLALPLAGCGSIPKDYVDAERSAFELWSPEYLEYVENDDELSEDDKQVRKDLVTGIDYRISEAEKSLEED